MFDRDIYFGSVRKSLFSGTLNQSQVDGQEAILATWERDYPGEDLRWLAYMLATTAHETGFAMWPIEEHGKGSGMEYGKKDPETGQTYYGRGFVQLTWRDNYAKADRELLLDPQCEWDAAQQLRIDVAAPTMFIGMIEGWFRKSSDGQPQDLPRYFNDATDNPYGAREIINGDKSKVPSWSNGVSIGNLIKEYHDCFFDALYLSANVSPPAPAPEPSTVVVNLTLSIRLEPGKTLTLYDSEENAIGTLTVT
jgi:putative chitinase